MPRAGYRRTRESACSPPRADVDARCAPGILLLVDFIGTDPITGKQTGLTGTVRRALRALNTTDARYAVIGATALAVRGLPRMTRDLDVAVELDDAGIAFEALQNAGFDASVPPERLHKPESTVLFMDPKTGLDVDIVVAAGDPESYVIREALTAKVFGIPAPVASLEHLLLLFMYSNEPKHIGDFAAIVGSEHADPRKVEIVLQWMHPQILRDFLKRVKESRSPPPAPSRPPKRSSVPPRS